jgi:hypothetical protein
MSRHSAERVLRPSDATQSTGCNSCLAASWSCAASRSKGSMVTISIPDPDGTGTKMTVETRWYATNDSPSMSSSSVHHPIVGTIHAVQAERPTERDDLIGRPHRQGGTLPPTSGSELNGAQQQRDSVCPPESIHAARHLRFDRLGHVSGDLSRKRAHLFHLGRQCAYLLAPIG